MARGGYADFDLEITRDAGGRYQARVLDSPAGQASAEYRQPFSDLELENFVLRIGHTRSGTRRLNSPEMRAAEMFGQRLFEAAFRDGVRECLTSCLHQVDRNELAGLRLRLHLIGVPELANLPWEFLYHPTLRRFIVLSSETPIIRYSDLPRPVTPFAVQPPLKLLGMVSAPSDFPGLDVQKEKEKIEAALRDLRARGLIDIEWLESGTLAALQRRLRRDPVHVLHYIGHGGWDETAQNGVLVFEDEFGRGRPVNADYLGTILHDHRSLRLVMLNACEGARTSPTDSFAGVASTLVHQGIPAVVAMQFEITDDAAIELSHVFYETLADGYSAEAALAEARKAIFSSGNDVEWGTPVLYMRSDDGVLFDLPANPTPVQPPMPAPVSPSVVATLPVVEEPEPAPPDLAAYEDEALPSGASPPPPHRGAAAALGSWPFRAVAAIGVSGVVIALALWQPWSSSRGGNNREVVLPSCDPPLETGADWTTLNLASESRMLEDDTLFEAQAAGYRKLAPDRTLLQVRMKVTNQAVGDARYNTDWRYSGIVVDSFLYPLTCFSLLAGGSPLDAGLSGLALIGVELPVAPAGQVEVGLQERRFVVSRGALSTNPSATPPPHAIATTPVPPTGTPTPPPGVQSYTLVVTGGFEKAGIAMPAQGDIRVFQAIGLGVPWGDVMRAVYPGRQVRTSLIFNGVINTGVYDVADAKKLLAAAGYPAGTAVVVFRFSSPAEAPLAEALRGYLNTLGVSLVYPSTTAVSYFTLSTQGLTLN